MMQKKDNTVNTIEYQLKYYQIKKQIEEIRKENKKDSIGSYADLLKYRRGKSKH